MKMMKKKKVTSKYITETAQTVISTKKSFLFNLQKPKSETANPKMNLVAMQDRVEPETESAFDDVFKSLDGIANASDNIEARNYMDQLCESGTLGTKGNI